MNEHGRQGFYAPLLVRYLRLNETCVLTSLRQAGINIARDARPVFIDPDSPPPGSC